MYAKTDCNVPQQWTVHAQFTISHEGLNDNQQQQPQTHTEQDENGVRMVYTWNSQPESVPVQKGDLVFTSTPPPREPRVSHVKSQMLSSSGYGSELLSPTASVQKGYQGFNRKCTSTCTLVLSSNLTGDANKQDDVESSLASRTHSLRCQTPTLRCERKDAFFGCGDPWCYHSNYGDDARFSPVPEGEEVGSFKSPSTGRSSSHREQRSRSSPPRMEKSKDVSVQTYEMIDKCTSPFLRMDSFDFKNAKGLNKDYRERNLKKRGLYNTRRKTEPIFSKRSSVSSSITPDSLESKKVVRSVRRNSGEELKNSNTSNSNTSDPNKKPRTVHIDVYCTGTENESDSSSSNEEESDGKTASSPQTVFESHNMKITHERSQDTLPYHLKNKDDGKSKPVAEDFLKKLRLSAQNDDDGLSSGYPSRSSFSGHRDSQDFGSSFSTSAPWSSMSFDNESMTSWKDTYSDLGSLSRSSIVPSGKSADFLQRNPTQSCIDEQPEIDFLKTPSLQLSDSFEYADSVDKFRIHNMEKHWRSPQKERLKMHEQQRVQKDQQQQQQQKELLQEESDSSGSEEDASEKAWTFVKDDKQLDRVPTVRRTNKAGNQSNNIPSSSKAFVVDSNTKVVTACKSPSILIIKQKMQKDPSLRAPFTVLPGVFTEQREIARKFGRIVDVFKKPGHHIGPAKNPDCSCDHCRSYFELRNSHRGRARSVDSNYGFCNWKDPAVRVGYRIPSKRENKSTASFGFTDF